MAHGPLLCMDYLPITEVSAMQKSFVQKNALFIKHNCSSGGEIIPDILNQHIISTTNYIFHLISLVSAYQFVNKCKFTYCVFVSLYLRS